MERKNPQTTKLPHMGNFIKNKIDANTVSYAELSRRMGISQPTLHGYFVQETLQTRVIFKLSQALGYNFFTDLIQLLPEDVQSANKTSYQQTILQQQQQINDLQKEVAIYKEIVSKKV